jgi:hypothetical protein
LTPEGHIVADDMTVVCNKYTKRIVETNHKDTQLIADAPLLLAEVKRLREGIQDALYLFQEAGNPKMSDKKRLDTICDALLEVIE